MSAALQDLHCWRCGAALPVLPAPLGRREECPGCHADLHVCRMCTFYDPKVSRACREPVADEIRDKEHANFCGYLKARPGAPVASGADAADAARAALSNLFGDDAGAAPGTGTNDADAARAALDRLFADDDKTS